MRPIVGLFIMSMLVVMTSCKETTKWSDYTSKEGGFTVTMPSELKLSDKVYGKQTIHFITWKPSSFALDMFKLFEVSYMNCPGAAGADSTKLNALLDTCINMRKKDFTELDIDAQPILLNGYPGRAFMFQPQRGNTIAIVKECIVGNKRYDLTVISKKDYPTNNEINRFFNSFKVLK